MKEIKLSKGFVALVDNEDFEELNKYRWSAIKNSNVYYAYRGYKGNSFWMHRVIMNAPKGSIIDHKDRDGLNNQKSNLRFVNKSQNGANRRPKKGKRFLGVHKFGDRYVAYCKKNGYNHRSKSFSTEEEAALAYNELASKLHGEFACLNIV